MSTEPKSSLSELMKMPRPSRTPALDRMLELLPEIEQAHAAGWSLRAIHEHMMKHDDFKGRRFGRERFVRLLQRAREIYAARNSLLV